MKREAREGQRHKMKRETEQREQETVNHTPCHRNKVNRLKETENECAAEGDREGKWRRRSGKVLPKNTILIALRSAIAKAQKEIELCFHNLNLPLKKCTKCFIFIFFLP